MEVETMKSFRLILQDGKKKTIKAKSPKEARIKYYGSADHFRTERAVDKVERYTPTRRKKKAFNPFDFGF